MDPENGFFLLSHQHLSLESITLKTFPQPFPLGVAGITVDVPLLSVCTSPAPERKWLGQVKEDHTKPSGTGCLPITVSSLITGSSVAREITFRRKEPAGEMHQCAHYFEIIRSGFASLLPKEISSRQQPEATTGLAKAQKDC